MKKKLKKVKIPPIDGLSDKDIKKIRAAIRQVWHWSYPKKLVIARCTGKGGFLKCEKCLKRAPKIFVDHKIAVGDVDGGFIERLFTASKNLQGLCKKCHDAKTKEERQEARELDKMLYG